jgi:Uma2 family endonuclease
MAIPLISVNDAPATRLFTAADLAAMPTHLPSGDIDFELDRGRLMVMVPPGHLHGGVQANLTIALGIQGQQKGLGRVFTEAGVVLSRKPDTVVAPDIAFITAAKLPVRESPEGYLETIPDLVVEIRSRNDTSAELEAKVAAYLAAGVRVVWVVDPTAKSIADYKPGGSRQVFDRSATLAADEIIPGFRVALADLFSI